MKFDVPFTLAAGLAAANAVAVHRPEGASDEHNKIVKIENEIHHLEEKLAQDYSQLWNLFHNYKPSGWWPHRAGSTASSSHASTTAKQTSTGSGGSSPVTTGVSSTDSYHTETASDYPVTTEASYTDTFSASTSSQDSSLTISQSVIDTSSPVYSTSVESTSSASPIDYSSSSTTLVASPSSSPETTTVVIPQTSSATSYTTFTTLCTETLNGTTTVETHTHSAPITSSTLVNATSSYESTSSVRSSVVATTSSSSAVVAPTSGVTNSTSSIVIPPSSTGLNSTSSIVVVPTTSASVNSTSSVVAVSTSSIPVNSTSSVVVPTTSAVNSTSVVASTSTVVLSTSSAVNATSVVPRTSSVVESTSSVVVPTTSAVNSTSSVVVPTTSTVNSTSSVVVPTTSAVNSTSSVVVPTFVNSTSSVAPTTSSVVLSTSSSASVNSTTSAAATSSSSSSTKVSSSSTSTSSTMAPTPTGDITSSAHCSELCSQLQFTSGFDISPVSCQSYSAGSTVTITGGQADKNCGSTVTPDVDICRVVLTISTSFASQTYMEVWLPNAENDSWNGRAMSTDNGGLNGCVHFADMNYVSGKGFAAIGDNGGHNSSAFDGTWAFQNNENIIDWSYRARHESVAAGKEVISQFYGEKPNKSYYVGCSTGGQQGMHSAQYFPDDFDGIIAGSSAADFNHLQDWSGRFYELTGNSSSDSFLTLNQWILVQSAILDQCDEKLDGVNDGILEDPTICKFDASVLQCANGSTDNCLTSTQVTTVQKVFTELYDADGQLLYPSLLYGSQVDAYRLGQLSGSVQGIVNDWFRFGVYNNTDFDVSKLNNDDFSKADSLDKQHGYVSSFNGDLSGFRAAGKKLMMYHGMADPLVSGGNSQRYYLKVAKSLGISNDGMDEFFRYFRIAGMAHCGVGGISGAGPWMFGQNAAAAVEGVQDNIVDRLVDWVENSKAPDTLTGTKFFYDTPADGVQYIREHCRFPYRTTFNGGDYTRSSGWDCKLIEDWQSCAVGATPRLCNADGTFT